MYGESDIPVEVKQLQESRRGVAAVKGGKKGIDDLLGLGLADGVLDDASEDEEGCGEESGKRGRRRMFGEDMIVEEWEEEEEEGEAENNLVGGGRVAR